MSPFIKFLIGLAAVSLLAWVQHGPMGQGEMLVNRLEADAKAAVAKTNLPVNVALGREPLSRLATMSGDADQFQREGQGELKGLNDIVRDVDGVSGVRWADEPAKTVIPLFAETLIQIVLAYLIGLALAWLLFGRRRRESFY